MGLCFSEPRVDQPQSYQYTTAPVSQYYKAQVMPTPKASFSEGDPQNVKELPYVHSQYHYTNAYQQPQQPQMIYVQPPPYATAPPSQMAYATAPPSQMAYAPQVPIYVVPQPQQQQHHYQQNSGGVGMAVAGGLLMGAVLGDMMDE